MLNLILSILSIVFVFFIPGFLISLVFFPMKKIDLIERLALSFALSIAIIPLMVFYTNLIGIPITSLTVLLQTTAIILLTGIVLIFRKFKKSV